VAESKSPPRALEGIKVVELASLDTMPNQSAAMAGKAFADHGAEVIKVEPPRTGAPERMRGPFKDELPDPETGGVHLYLNTNKLGVTIDITRERGRELLFKLLDSADILLNPNLPADNDRMGIAWRTLVEKFPRLIVVSLTTFGVDSRYRDARGGDLIATHMGGVGWETPVNQVTDFATHTPLKPADRQADFLAGFTAAAAAMCALFQRKRTGKGQHVDVSSWLAMVSMFRPAVGIHTHESADAPYGVRIRTRAKLGLPWVYPCKDGWVSFSPITERFWKGTKAAMGNPEWAESEIFSSYVSRAINHDAVEASLIDWLTDVPRQEAFEKAQGQHVPCFPVNLPSEVADNPQYKARGFFAEHDHPAARVVRMPGAPCTFSRTPWQLRRGAPRLGEHNMEILGARLGISADDLAALRREGII
jgi:crotonobetainyl-CoA:carnitine CoA-transferase CaiB-like acyl-CoA transferase